MALTIDEVLRGMVPAPKGARSLFDLAVRRARKVRVRGRDPAARARRREIARIRTASETVSGTLRGIALKSPFLDRLHPFYRELVYLAVNSDEYRLCLSRLYSVSRIIEKLARESISRVRRARRPGEMAACRRQFFGRLLSLLEGVEDCLEKLRYYQGQMLSLSSINPELMSVVIAGVPNVGKSSLLRSLTRAKPEVRPYPFTTKSIIVGHRRMDSGFVQFIDTPGLLDRPLEEKGRIERHAILAIKHLRGAMVYLFDPSETCGYDLAYQARVYRSLKEWFPQVPKILAANKVDILDSGRALRLLRMMGDERREVLFISALKGQGLDLLLERVEAEIRGEGVRG